MILLDNTIALSLMAGIRPAKKYQLNAIIAKQESDYILLFPAS